MDPFCHEEYESVKYTVVFKAFVIFSWAISHGVSMAPLCSFPRIRSISQSPNLFRQPRQADHGYLFCWEWIWLLWNVAFLRGAGTSSCGGSVMPEDHSRHFGSAGKCSRGKSSCHEVPDNPIFVWETSPRLRADAGLLLSVRDSTTCCREAVLGGQGLFHGPSSSRNVPFYRFAEQWLFLFSILETQIDCVSWLSG